MKAVICALALVGLTAQANAAIYNMSCGQLIDAKVNVKVKIADVNAKLKDARNADQIEFLKGQKEQLVNSFLALDSEINDRCKGDDYND
jgi:hypothetical protein